MRKSVMHKVVILYLYACECYAGLWIRRIRLDIVFIGRFIDRTQYVFHCSFLHSLYICLLYQLATYSSTRRFICHMLYVIVLLVYIQCIQTVLSAEDEWPKEGCNCVDDLFLSTTEVSIIWHCR